MKSKAVRLLVYAAFSALAALGATWWFGANIAVQVGGTNNKIEQNFDPKRN
jgi:hypothetical protein